LVIAVLVKSLVEINLILISNSTICYPVKLLLALVFMINKAKPVFMHMVNLQLPSLGTFCHDIIIS